MHKFITAFATASLFATPALAGERTAIVRHADLDLKSEAGRNQLNRRIAAATEQVCGSYAGASADEVTAINRCRGEAQRGIAVQLSKRWGATAVARR
jgi:UrcA family protein